MTEMAHNHFIMHRYICVACIWQFTCLSYAPLLGDHTLTKYERESAGNKETGYEINLKGFNKGQHPENEVSEMVSPQISTRYLNLAALAQLARLGNNRAKSKSNLALAETIKLLDLLLKGNKRLATQSEILQIEKLLPKAYHSYPAEYGLTYASFVFESMTLEYKKVPKTNLTATLTIDNIGDADGEDVVECYISWTNHSLPVPKQQLVHFDRVHIQAKSQLTYAFTLTWLSWAFWSNGTWAVQTGTVILCCGDQPPASMLPNNDHIICWPFQVYGSD